MGIPILRAVARMVLSPSAIHAVADMALRASAIPAAVALRNIVRSRRGLPPVRIFRPEMVQRQPAVGGGRCLGYGTQLANNKKAKVDATAVGGGRSLGYCTQVANNKKAEVDLTFTLEGLDGCQLESLLPLVYQHLDLVGLRQTMSKQLTSTLPPKTRFNIHFNGLTAFQGFEVSEIENLTPSAKQYLKLGVKI